MKKFSLKKKIIIGVISLLIVSAISSGIMIYLGFQALAIALSDKYSKTYTPNELPSDTFLLAVTNPKGELDFIDYHTYKQDKISSQPSYKLFEGNQGSTDCGLKIFCTIRKDDDEFIADKRGLLNEGLTTTYKISANQIIPISITCSTSKCSIDRKISQQVP